MFRGSLLNSIVGPVMRGPSSSHTAAPYLIARACRELATSGGRTLVRARVQFDPSGSFAAVHEAQGSDEGFAAGLLGIAITGADYAGVLARARDELGLRFEVTPLLRADHPNCVELELETAGALGESTELDRFAAVSTGGGTFEIRSLNGEPLGFTGDTGFEAVIGGRMRSCAAAGEEERNRPAAPLTAAALLDAAPDAAAARGSEVLVDAAESYEADVLALSRAEVRDLARARLSVLLDSVRQGLAAAPEASRMRFLAPSSRRLLDATLPLMLVSRTQQVATAAALAVMEHDVARGLVAAAPTAGSAGIVPGTLYALAADGLGDDALVDAFLVMALVGGAFASGSTFAAECGGCAVETGAGAAMAAGGLVAAYGGDPRQVFDAASLCLVNTLGLVCDPVAGEVEIPCHARNVAGVAHAFASAAAVLGGFTAALPFDEMAAVTARVGAQLHPDLRCTARGGCAATPTGLRLAQRPRVVAPAPTRSDEETR